MKVRDVGAASCFLGLLAAGVAGQTLAAPPRVAATRIEAAAEDVARLSRYLEIRPGQPLDPATIRHVVELLHATGEFQDVVVEARDQPEGVELVFRPVPAPLLRAIRLAGDPVLSVAEARRTSRLRPREPLWPSRLDRAARDLAVALVERGYLEARVVARAEGQGGATDAVFTVEAGALVRVRRASLSGAPPEMLTRLSREIRPPPGEAFVRSRTRATAEQLRRSLVATGRFGAQVEVREAYDPAGAAMDLVFEVAQTEPVRLLMVGPSVAGAERGTVERLLQEGGLARDALEEARDALEGSLRRNGHREPRVRYDLSPAGGARVLTFTVEPGPRTVAASVTVTGDAPPGLERFLTTTPAGPVEDRVVAADVEALQRVLQEQGYTAAQVEADVAEGGGLAPVAFRVRAGSRTMVTAVTIESPQSLPVATPARELRLRPGGPYRQADLARDREALLTDHRNAGHLQAVVLAEVALSDARTEAAITFRVQPGPVTLIEHVVIAPLPHTREEVLRRELTLGEGAPLSFEQVLESQRRLSALGLFERVTITEMDPQSAGPRTLVVRAEDAPLTSVAYGIGYAERERLRGSVEVTRRNLFGLDRRLSTFVRASVQGSSRFVVTYREPHLFRLRQELFVTAYSEKEDRELVDFTRHGVSVQAARALSPRWNMIVRETYQKTRTYRPANCLEVDRAFCPSTLSGPSAALVFDTRDDALDPRRGNFALLDGQLSHAVLGGDSLVKLYVQGATYLPLSPRTVVALSARLGLGRTLDESLSELPSPDRFFAGGDYSLRGFGVDEVRKEGGNALLLSGAEVRHGLSRTFTVAAFADAGNVYPLVSAMSLRDLRYVAGLGLRYRSAVGPLRFDWGYKLDRRVGEDPYHLHFTVGHAF